MSFLIRLGVSTCAAPQLQLDTSIEQCRAYDRLVCLYLLCPLLSSHYKLYCTTWLHLFRHPVSTASYQSPLLKITIDSRHTCWRLPFFADLRHVLGKMTSTTYYPSSSLSRHSSKYNFSSGSSGSGSSSKFYLNSSPSSISSSSSSSSTASSASSSYLRTRSSYDLNLNSYRPSSYSSPSSRSYTSSSFLSSKYSPGMFSVSIFLFPSFGVLPANEH